MVPGTTGKILRVNLTDRRVSVDEPDDLFYRRYLGGAGFIGYYLLKEVKPGTDPLAGLGARAVGWVGGWL